MSKVDYQNKVLPRFKGDISTKDENYPIIYSSSMHPSCTYVSFFFHNQNYIKTYPGSSKFYNGSLRF